MAQRLLFPPRDYDGNIGEIRLLRYGPRNSTSPSEPYNSHLDIPPGRFPDAPRNPAAPPLWHPECLDTRIKIVDAGPAQARGAFVAGYFDPVTVEHVRRLKEIREDCGRVTILLSDPPEPILNARARAEVLAALDVVDSVVLPREGAFYFTETEADRARFQRLADHIRERHGIPSPR